MVVLLTNISYFRELIVEHLHLFCTNKPNLYNCLDDLCALENGRFTQRELEAMVFLAVMKDAIGSDFIQEQMLYIRRWVEKITFLRHWRYSDAPRMRQLHIGVEEAKLKRITFQKVFQLYHNTN